MTFTHSEDAIITFIRHLVFLHTTDIACPTEVIAIKASMTAFFSLHCIISSNE
jgi:hypothetical protein